MESRIGSTLPLQSAARNTSICNIEIKKLGWEPQPSSRESTEARRKELGSQAK